jgi:hypothetical protein
MRLNPHLPSPSSAASQCRRGRKNRFEQSLAQAKRLLQSILKKAFEGKFVAQNPEDEPASVLLEKIRLQKQIKPKKGSS